MNLECAFKNVVCCGEIRLFFDIWKRKFFKYFEL